MNRLSIVSRFLVSCFSLSRTEQRVSHSRFSHPRIETCVSPTGCSSILDVRNREFPRLVQLCDCPLCNIGLLCNISINDLRARRLRWRLGGAGCGLHSGGPDRAGAAYRRSRACVSHENGPATLSHHPGRGINYRCAGGRWGAPPPEGPEMF